MSFSDVVEHYRLRGFSRAAVDGLLDEMKAKIEGEILVIDEHLSRPLSGLPQAFSPVVQVQIEHRALPPVSAILAFAFGYRLKSRAAPGAERRLPGRNNHALAAIVTEVHRIMPEVPICTQFEITDALEDVCDLSPSVSSPAEDWGTAEVLDHFKAHFPGTGLSKEANVVVVAHAHHYARCARLVQRSGFSAFPPPKPIELYIGYDPLEAQPRAMSERLVLRSDFISMLATFA